MESRGRRATRTQGLIAAPPEPVEFPATAGGPAEAPTEPSQQTDILAAEPPVELEATVPNSAFPPGALTAAKVTKAALPDDLGLFGRDALAALAQSQAALTRGLEALSDEIAGLALSGIDTAARTATKMLGVKTISDAIEINAGFAYGNLDTLVGGSAKLSQLGVKLAAETSQPILAQFGKGWIKAGRLGS